MTVSLSVRGLLVGVLMVAAAGMSLVLTPSGDERELAPDIGAMIPQAFGEWVIDPTLIPVVPVPDVQVALDKYYDQVVNRTYVNSRAERIMLTIAYGGDQSHALKAHRQEFCYAAQGFQIRQLTQGTLDLGTASIPVVRMLAVQGLRSEPVTYWLTMGDKAVLGRLERLMVQLRYGLSGRVPDGMLVRVSSLSTDTRVSFLAHQEFVSTLLGAMKVVDVSRLLGSPRF
jgi:EpsI family protein